MCACVHVLQCAPCAWTACYVLYGGGQNLNCAPPPHPQAGTRTGSSLFAATAYTLFGRRGAAGRRGGRPAADAEAAEGGPSSPPISPSEPSDVFELPFPVATARSVHQQPMSPTKAISDTLPEVPSHEAEPGAGQPSSSPARWATPPRPVSQAAGDDEEEDARGIVLMGESSRGMRRGSLAASPIVSRCPSMNTRRSSTYGEPGDASSAGGLLLLPPPELPRQSWTGMEGLAGPSAAAVAYR